MNNIEKNKVTSLEIIVRMIGNKPYYEIKYKKLGENFYNVGYSSYSLKNVLLWKDECFEFVENKKTNADKIKNMSDEELARFLTTFNNKFGEEYEGEISCIEWLQSEAEQEKFMKEIEAIKEFKERIQLIEKCYRGEAGDYKEVL